MELCHVVREVISYTVDRGTSAKGCKTSITAKQFRVEYYLNEKKHYSTHIIIEIQTENSFAFMLINNDCLCHFDQCFSNSKTHQRQILQYKKAVKRYSPESTVSQPSS